MMVSQMGFSKLGQVAWQSGGGPSFVGAQAGQAPDCSGHTADLIDAEVKELVERSYRYQNHWFPAFDLHMQSQSHCWLSGFALHYVCCNA